MWSEIWNFITTWSWYALLGSLAAVIPAATTVLWQFIQRWLDKYYADDLPEHAGHFTRAIAARRWEQAAPAVLCIPEKTPLAKLGDAFAPSQNSILLSQKTFFKRDPTFWAIGAHELGHAILYERVPRFVNIVMVMRHLTPLVSAFAMIVLLANIFIGHTAVLSTALGLFWLVVAMSFCVCIDELAASWIAIRLLREDGRLRKEHWLGVYGVLATALMTYVGAAVGSLVVVLLYDALAASSISTTPRPDTVPLVGLSLYTCLGIACVMTGFGLLTLKNLFDKAERFDPGMEISNQQMNQVTAELELLKDKTGPEYDKRRNELNAENTKLLKRFVIRTVRTLIEYAGILTLLWLCWNLSNHGVFLAIMAIAVHRLQVVIGLFLIPLTLLFGVSALVILIPIFIPIGLIINRMDESLKSDTRQQTANPHELVKEAQAALNQVRQWKNIWRVEHRLARFPEIIHLPFVISIAILCGQQLIS